MHRLLLGSALCLLAAPALGRDGSEAALARAHTAAGGAALDALETAHAKLRVETAGLSGSGERFEDLRTGRFALRFDLGVIAIAEGFDGTTPWTLEGNNPARPERGEDKLAEATNEAYRRSAAHLTGRAPAAIEALGERSEGERRFAVLAITPERGRRFELWLDAESWLAARVVEKTATDTLTFTYDDYRRVGGVAVPFRVRESNGDAKYDSVITLDSIAFDEPLDETRFALPAPPPRDFGIAGGAAATTLPFTLANNHIFIDAKLGERRVNLLLDTGAINVVTPELARELGLAVAGELEGRGVGEKKVDVGIAKLARVELGDAFLVDQTFYVIPLDPLSAVEGRPAVGIIGYEVFRRFVARIDYEKRQLTLHDPARFTYQGSGTSIPFEFNEHVPRLEAELDGVSGKFDVDTGSRSSLTLAAPFVAKHGLRAKYAPRFAAATGWGVGGPSRSELARAGSFTLAGYTIARPVTHLSLQTAGAFAAEDLAGNIGGGILRRFNLVLDYERQRIVFEPNASFAAPDVFDRSGLWLNDAGDALAVMDVTAGGPGERAGLRAGERIRRVEGAAVAPGALLALRERFRSEPPGTRLRLGVESASGERREVTLTLAELI